MVTTIQDWLKPVEHTLPSGKTALLLPLDVMSLVMENGNVPNFLMGALMGTATNTPASAEDVAKFLPILNKIAKAMFISPRIVDTQEEFLAKEGIMAHHISLPDKMALMNWAIGGSQAVSDTKRFSEQQTTSVVTLQSGESLPTSSIDGDGNTE